MLDPMIQRLLEQTIDSPIKLQLLLMYYENPRMEGSAFQIAGRTYRDIWSTRAALDELSQEGILTAIDQGGEMIYRYRPRPEYTEPILRLVQSYNEPMERDDLQRVLHEVASYAPYRRAAQGGFSYEMLSF